MDLAPFKMDTDRMALEPAPGHPGAFRQMLLFDDDAGSFVQITYGPPGFTEKLRDLVSTGPHRHYHKTVVERHYVLDGDYPVWHWVRPDTAGTLSRVVRHDYLENRPLTLHGITADATSERGWKILQWANGSGTEIYEPGADIETVEVGFVDPVPRLAFDTPVKRRATALPWEPHPAEPGWCLKKLSGEAPRLPAVELVQIPSRCTAVPAVWSKSSAEHRWIFILAGSISIELTAENRLSKFALGENAFFAIPARTVVGHGLVTSENGCVMLSVGSLF